MPDDETVETVENTENIDDTAEATDEVGEPDASSTFPLPEDHFYGIAMVTRRSHNGRQVEDERAVRRIQRALGAPETGRYDGPTVAAVRAHQSAVGHDATGLVDADTWRTIRP